MIFEHKIAKMKEDMEKKIQEKNKKWRE